MSVNVTYEKKTDPICLMSSSALTYLPHMHKEIEIVYVIDGECVAIADRSRFDMKKGDIYISFPNQIHYYEHCTPGRYIVAIVSTDIIPYLSSLMREKIPTENVITPQKDDIVHEHFEKMALSKGEYRYTELCGYINLIMSFIMPRLSLRATKHTDSTILHSVMNFCADNYMNAPTLDDAADALNKSKYYISHLMNDRLNLSFTDYVNTLRVNAACEALRISSTKITDISEEVGFGTIRSFNRTFKEIMGTTPQEYRRSFQTIT